MAIKRFVGVIRKGLRVVHDKRTAILFFLALSITGFLHSYNMFHYPYFEADEGTYLSQAFAVREQGELSLYVYWYDHPPFGWIFISSFIDLVGDWNVFGSALNTGRVMMLTLHLIQVSLLFFIVRRVSRSPWLAFLAVLLYSASPLAVYFQRRVLLDNMMLTWVMLSVALLFLKETKLRHILMSGVFYGLAVVTKVTSVMFGPALLYLLLTAKWEIHKGFRSLGWLLVSGSIVSTWIIYAFIKTELFPAPNGERVSLIGALSYQASRGTGAHFWEATSSFRDNLSTWLILDSTYMYILSFALLSAFVLVFVSKTYRFFALCTLLYTFFLIRGGVVIGFYILPLLPFAVISIIGLLDYLKQKIALHIPKYSPVISALVFGLVVGAFTYHYIPKVTKYLTVDETTNQIESIRWVKRNIPEDVNMMVDIYGMTELLDPGFENDKVFKNADWYFKIAKDPAIRYDKYRDDWRNLDYIFISHEMIYQSSLHKLPVVYDAIRNSVPVMVWDNNSTSFIDVQNFRSTNGDWTALYRVNSNTRTQLKYAWSYYRDNFLESYGQVVDPQTGLTTSEGQSYAMLRAALMNDRDSFKGIWLWTQHHLQHRVDDKLLSWSFKDGKQLDAANASDADLDIALALIFAFKIFDEPAYLEDAKVIMRDIWRQSVVEINGHYYLLSAEKTHTDRGAVYMINPSYFSPAHYRIFAEVDSEYGDRWLKLADDTYWLLDRISARSGGVGLAPNWLALDQKTGQLHDASAYIDKRNADDFGYDAFRLFWRVGLDVEWYNSEDGKEYLERIGEHFAKEWKNRGTLSDLYNTDGTRLQSNPNLSVASGILTAVEIASDSQTSSDIYNKVFVTKAEILEEKEYVYWGDPNNYYDSNWVWFGLALFNDNLPNLWHLYGGE